MKNLHIAIKTSAFILISTFILGASKAQAKKELARVTKVSGNAFVTQGSKRANMLVKGDLIPEYADVIVEDNSILSFVDYFDRTYHLSGGAHVKVMGNFIELMSGKVWVQSVSQGKSTLIQTANAKVQHDSSEFIVSFSGASGRTQLLVISGEVQLANSLESQLRVSVDAGKFSFVDPEYQKGMPRVPTSIGFDSYKTITENFKGIRPMEKKGVLEHLENQGQDNDNSKLAKEEISIDAINRTIASAEKETSDDEIIYPDGPKALKLAQNTKHNRGKIIYIGVQGSSPSRVPSSTATKSKKVQKTGAKKAGIKFTSVKEVLAQKSSEAPIELRVFGEKDSGHRVSKEVVTAAVPEKEMDEKEALIKELKSAPVMADKKEKSDRMPASVLKKSRGLNVIPESAFEKSYNSQSGGQRRHSPEVLELIKELKSYDKDFDLSY